MTEGITEEILEIIEMWEDVMTEEETTDEMSEEM